MGHANAHEPRLEARARAEPQPPVAVQRAHRRHRSTSASPTASAATRGGARYFDDLVEEMEYKGAHGIGTLTDEQYRLVFVGVPCYPIFRRFNEMFTERGGDVRQLDLPVVRLGRREPGLRVRPRRPDREPRRGAARRRARRDGQHVLPDPARSPRMIDELRGRRRRLPPDQELPHGVDRPRRQPARADGRRATSRACSSSPT